MLRSLVGSGDLYKSQAEAGLLRLVAYIAGQRDLLALGTLDDDALYAVRRQLGDLRQCAEALGVGL